MQSILLGRATRDPSEIIRALASLDKKRHANPVMQALEDRCTPLEFADALSRSAVLASGPRSFLYRDTIAGELLVEAPETYRRVDVVPDITLYSDPAFPKRGKILLLVFTGLAHRPMISTVSFLQFLPAAHFDIVMLRDRSNLSFESGIAGFAGTLLELAVRLGRDLDAPAYARTATLGTSLGALTALRAGLLLHAERAIAVGGRFNWHIGRLLKRGATIPAFDLLCACGPRDPTRLIAVHMADHAIDVEHAERLERILPVDRRIISGADTHNIIYHLVLEGRFRAFLAEILDF